MLVLTRKRNESINVEIGGVIVKVTIVEIRGGAVRVGLEGPRTANFRRAELDEEPFVPIQIETLVEGQLLTWQSSGNFASGEVEFIQGGEIYIDGSFRDQNWLNNEYVRPQIAIKGKSGNGQNATPGANAVDATDHPGIYRKGRTERATSDGD